MHRFIDVTISVKVFEDIQNVAFKERPHFFEEFYSKSLRIGDLLFEKSLRAACISASAKSLQRSSLALLEIVAQCKLSMSHSSSQLFL